MNFDPLSDTSSPRYAYESDEEDELNPLLNVSTPRLADVSIRGYKQCSDTSHAVIIASGEAGAVWAQGVDLGERCGEIVVNELTVGLIFSPAWTDAIVIVSEASLTLPAWAMHSYASTIVDFFKPTLLLLLDSYAAPVYIDTKPLDAVQAPVRYLRTSGKALPAPISPFAPPNLIQATAAAYASLASLPASQIDAILFLLPSPRVPIPRGRDITRSLHGSETSGQYSDWPESALQEVHQSIAGLAGARGIPPWKGSETLPKQLEVRHLSDIGDGGMYM
ncbi:hypothetical protein BC834DRAFT_891012 [Gloeopeniophorella convolvens]|nr:hypothetical protein BC834DRAFT_891012 [Gloeopeniophorella convolvens]